MKNKKTFSTMNTQNDNSQDDLFFDLDDIASATECTGLIPTPPESEAEAESYTQLYSIPKPQESNKKKNSRDQ
jgi:hypothetical protein